MARYKKAVVATVGAVVAIAAVAGLEIDPVVSTAIISVLTALGVYLFPNTD